MVASIETTSSVVAIGWLVADVTIDFFYEWTSTLYEGGFCEPPVMGSFSYRVNGWSAIPDNAWKVAGFPTEDYEDAPPTWIFNSGNSGPTGCTAGAALSVRQRLPFAPPSGFKVKIFNIDTNEPFDDDDPCILEAPGDGSACAFASIPPNTQFDVRAWMEGTPFADYGVGAVTATANPP